MAHRFDQALPPIVRPGRLAPAAILLLCFAGSVRGQDSDPGNLIQAAEEVLTEIIQLRGLELKKPVPKGIKPRSAIRDYVVGQLAKDYPPERLEKDRKAYVMLGLLEPELDLYQAILALLTDQVAGFYDTETETFYIADWIPDSMQRPVMAHELMHALQDQHFDLDTLLEAAEEDEDRLLALEALIEGEGVAVMFDYMLKPMGTKFQFLPGLARMIEDNAAVADSASNVFARSPAFLRSLLTFPYSYGAGFLQHFRQQYGWQEMARLYASPPLSSEQILHPEKYFENRDDPSTLPVQDPPSLLPPEWPRIHDGVLGEFTLRQVLQLHIGEESASLAAEGWDGDRFELFEGPQGHLALVLRSVWDTPLDAQEFYEAQQEVLQGRFPPREPARQMGGQEKEGASRHTSWQSGPVQIVLQLKDQMVETVQLERENRP